MRWRPNATGLSRAALLASRDALLIFRNRARSASVMSHPTYQGSLLVARLVTCAPLLWAARAAVPFAVDTLRLPVGPRAPSRCGPGMPCLEAIHTFPLERQSAPWWGGAPALGQWTSRYP